MHTIVKKGFSLFCGVRHAKGNAVRPLELRKCTVVDVSPEH